MTRVCKHHGEHDDWVRNGKPRRKRNGELGKTLWRCQPCDTEKKRRKFHETKLAHIQRRGGKCEICGYGKNPLGSLQFRYWDRSEKTLNLCEWKAWTKPAEVITAEIEKCRLLCANCCAETDHAEAEANAKPGDMTRYYRRSTKQRLLEAIAGENYACKHCGYDSCNRALHFHHRDPKTKLFDVTTRFAVKLTRRIDGRRLRVKALPNYRERLREAKKCDVLCFNCHCEVEYAS